MISIDPFQTHIQTEFKRAIGSFSLGKCAKEFLKKLEFFLKLSNAYDFKHMCFIKVQILIVATH